MTEQRHIQWDLTVNIPTMLAIATALVGAIAFGVRTYADLDARLVAGHSERTVLRRDVDRVDATAAELRRDQGQKLDALRAELRGDLRDVSGKLDQLLLRDGGKS